MGKGTEKGASGVAGLLSVKENMVVRYARVTAWLQKSLWPPILQWWSSTGHSQRPLSGVPLLYLWCDPMRTRCDG